MQKARETTMSAKKDIEHDTIGGGFEWDGVCGEIVPLSSCLLKALGCNGAKNHAALISNPICISPVFLPHAKS